jgi:hypothetical protein
MPQQRRKAVTELPNRRQDKARMANSPHLWQIDKTRQVRFTFSFPFSSLVCRGSLPARHTVMTHNEPMPGMTRPAERYQGRRFPVLVLR